MNNRPHSLFDRRPAVTYVGLTFAISWSAWGSLRYLAVDGLAEQFLFVVGGLGPFLAALLVRAAGEGSVRAWLWDAFRVRVAGRYYLAALALPALVLLSGAAIHGVLFDGSWTMDGLPSLELFPLLFAYVLLFGGGLEEPGWRGHLQPVLARTRGTLVAALIVGVIWATWHLPLFVLPGTIQTEMAFWLYLPNVVGLSVILAYLTAAASDSVIPAILLHAAVNSMANYYPIGGAFGAVGTTGYSILTVVVLVVAAAIVVRFGTGGVEARSDPETDPDRDDSPVQSRNTYRPS